MSEHRFVHHAMACEWQLHLVADDAHEADHAAEAAFAEVDRLESELSRFVESSDIARTAELTAGQSLIVDPDAFACLALSLELWRRTGGAFDISLGGGLDDLRLDRATRTVTVSAERAPDRPIPLDLGGVGKGYAIDRALEQLEDWDLESGVLTSGQSTVRPFGGTRSLSVRDPRDHEAVLATVTLEGLAFSGSGTLLHGQHIVDPRTGDAATGPIGAWAIANDAAVSDALSTTFMILDPEEIPSICESLDASALWVSTDGALRTHGEIPGLERTPR